MSTYKHTLVFALVTRTALCFTWLCTPIYMHCFLPSFQKSATSNCLKEVDWQVKKPQNLHLLNRPTEKSQAVWLPVFILPSHIFSTLCSQNSVKDNATSSYSLEKISDQYLFSKNTNRLQIMCLINSDWDNVF